MKRDIIDINDFTVLIEQSATEGSNIEKCAFDEQVIGVAFYGSGDVDLSILYGDKKRNFNHTKGMALSFFADEKVQFAHDVSPKKSLQCITVVTATRNLQKLPNQEGEMFDQFLHQLVDPSDHYVEGPHFHMTHEMQQAVDKIFNSPYEGKTRIMFLRSQVTELLSHFFGQLSVTKTDTIKEQDREKLYQAQEILLSNVEKPPSLSELCRLIGLNSYKLKKDFKELFGLPVFKYLQNERLTQAHDLLRERGVSIQEAAWEVGYESVSSFSNAFIKKFGFRPSEIRK